MPELKYQSLDAIPEELRGDAKQVGSDFVVTVVAKKKVDEFRENNIRLAQERDAAMNALNTLKPIVGDDIEKFTSELTTLRQTAQQVADGKLTAKGDIEAELANRTKTQRETYEAQLRDSGSKLSEATRAASEWKQKFERSVLHQQITNAVVGKDSVANPEALPDILSRAEAVFQVQPDGSVIPKKGDTIIYGADGASPMSAKEWLTKLVGEAPYLGRASSGGGAPGNRDGDGSKYGMSSADFEKLPPQERIRLHREAQNRR